MKITINNFRKIWERLPHDKNAFDEVMRHIRGSIIMSWQQLIELISHPIDVKHPDGNYEDILKELARSDSFCSSSSLAEQRELQHLLGYDFVSSYSTTPSRPFLYREDMERRVINSFEGRQYVNDALVLDFPGVTSIHSAVEPFDPTFWIKKLKRENPEWDDSDIEQHMELVRTNAAKRGSALHAGVETYLASRKGFDIERDMEDAGRPYFESLFRTLRFEIDHVIAIEPLVWWDMSKIVGYKGAGALGYIDLVATKDDKVILWDWKSADKPKREIYIKNYFIQVAAYSAMLYQTYGIKVDEARIAVAIPNREPQIFTLSRKEIEFYLRLFINEVKAYAKMRQEYEFEENDGTVEKTLGE